MKKRTATADATESNTGATAETPPSTTKEAIENPKLLVKGSVIFGYGLEPQPVGHFILTETDSTSIEEGEESDIDEVDDDETDSFGMSTENPQDQMPPDGHGDDQPYFNSDSAFQ